MSWTHQLSNREEVVLREEAASSSAAEEVEELEVEEGSLDGSIWGEPMVTPPKVLSKMGAQRRGGEKKSGKEDSIFG